MQPHVSLRRYAALLLIAVFIFSSCKEKTAQLPAFVNPPIPELNPKDTSITLQAEKGDTLLFANGTRIIIPADAFTTHSGKAVKGEVTVRYREFHNAASLILAGIPMSYDTAGTQQYLRTAGMFEFRAAQKDSDLLIADGKKVNVRLASYTFGNDYNFYYLNEEARTWDYLGTDTAEVNYEKLKLKAELVKLKPSFVMPFSENYFVFNYRSILDAYYNDDWNKVDQNANNPTAGNKAKKYGLTWLNCWYGGYITFRGIEQHAGMMVWERLSSTPFPKWLNTDYYVYDDKMVQKDIYRVKLRTWRETDPTFTATIRAVMPLKELFAFEPELWQKNYDSIMNKILAEEARLKIMADVYRTFDITMPGYHNWDQILKYQKNVELAADFAFETKYNEKLTQPDVFYIVGNNRCYVKYPKNEWGKILLAADSTACFVSIMPGNIAEVYTATDYSKLNIDSINSAAKKQYTFKLKVSKEIKSADDLMKIITGK
jgi:hypothetical protein